MVSDSWFCICVALGGTEAFGSVCLRVSKVCCGAVCFSLLFGLASVAGCGLVGAGCTDLCWVLIVLLWLVLLWFAVFLIALVAVFCVGWVACVSMLLVRAGFKLYGFGF